MTLAERKLEFIRQILDADDHLFELIEQAFYQLQTEQETVEEIKTQPKGGK